MSPAKQKSSKKSKNQSAQNKRGVMVLIAVALGAILLVAGVAFISSNRSTPATTDSLIPEDAYIDGAEDAKVTIVEFLDPECEACRAAFPVVKQLLAAYPQDVRLVVRYMPLHNNSVLAARATEAAGEQGKYWEMQELLFANQGIWGEQQSPQTALFLQYANELGLDTQAFADVLNSDKYQDKVQRDYEEGIALGVQGTPTFFINGQKVGSGDLVRVVEENLN